MRRGQVQASCILGLCFFGGSTFKIDPNPELPLSPEMVTQRSASPQIQVCSVSMSLGDLFAQTVEEAK